MQSIAQTGLNQGRLDRELVVQELARNTALSRADAEDVAEDIASRYQSAMGRAGQLGEQAKDVALEAVDKAGKTLLLGGLMMLLSLGAAVGGAALGVRDRRDRDRTIATGPETVTTTDRTVVP
jgi:hypothetical protein